jgi:predicted dehydrogenase (TIGR03970 family)
MKDHRPDVIVVGAGGSGAVVAARLSEDPGCEVVVLEAGPVPRGTHGFGPALLDARQVPGARPDHAATLGHAVRLTPDRPWRVPRGRILGGSTTVNGGYFLRARREDFERWAGLGNPAWTYSALLPHLRTLERDLDFGEDPAHGTDGPVPVSRSPLSHPAAAAFRSAAAHLGFPAEPDKNAQSAPGFGPVASNSVDGIRLNTGLCYLPPDVLDRPNLTVLGGSCVEQVMIERGRATGVVLTRAGRRSRLAAGTVVLSAGALVTPHLLLLSGVGPRADLERAGIPVQQDAPSIGSRVGDHPQLMLDWTPRDDFPPPTDSWLGGCLHLDSTTGPASGPGDIEILQSLIPMAGLMEGRTHIPGAPLSFLVSVQLPHPTGRLRLDPSDPLASPRIDFGYPGESEEALRRLRSAVRTTADLLSTPPLAALSSGTLPVPGSALDSDRALDQWIREHLGTAQHTCGTVPMGPADAPERAAVDQYGRVHGISGLRVADTSVLPDTPHRGPAATAVLIGEVIADAMRNGLR